MTYETSIHSQRAIPQLDAQTDILMQLLSKVILADGHVFASETQALVRGVNQLQLKDKFGKKLGTPDVRDWFAAYQLMLENEPYGLRPDIALTHLILQLSDWPDKQVVIDVLTEISLSDDNFHMEEKKLISIVRAFWQFEGLDAPNAKIDD